MTLRKAFLFMLAATLCGTTATAQAEADDVAPGMQCLRYLQSYERSMRIPQGLLTAISFVEAGRTIGPNNRLTAWPWTINVNGEGRYFETKEEAVAETRRLLDEGQKSIDVGCMQVNLRYHPNAFRTIEDAFEPATNVAYGAQFLNSLHDLQGSWAKAVERYHSSDDGRRAEYREKVLAFWNNDARDMVMNAVLAENTDTPYHRAVQDFIAGRYGDALDKYQAVVDSNPKDRLGLLGVAMSYEQLWRSAEAIQAYARYLVVEPNSHSVVTHIIEQAKKQPQDKARADLEVLAKAGVQNGDLMAALAEFASSAGDNDAAFSYTAQAIQQDPSVPLHYLNAGVLADRLKRPEVALGYYEHFLELFKQPGTFENSPVDDVRERVRFLRTAVRNG